MAAIAALIAAGLGALVLATSSPASYRPVLSAYLDALLREDAAQLAQTLCAEATGDVPTLIHNASRGNVRLENIKSYSVLRGSPRRASVEYHLADEASEVVEIPIVYESDRPVVCPIPQHPFGTPGT